MTPSINPSRPGVITISVPIIGINLMIETETTAINPAFAIGQAKYEKDFNDVASLPPNMMIGAR